MGTVFLYLLGIFHARGWIRIRLIRLTSGRSLMIRMTQRIEIIARGVLRLIICIIIVFWRFNFRVNKVSFSFYIIKLFCRKQSNELWTFTSYQHEWPWIKYPSALWRRWNCIQSKHSAFWFWWIKTSLA